MNKSIISIFISGKDLDVSKLRETHYFKNAAIISLKGEEMKIGTKVMPFKPSYSMVKLDHNLDDDIEFTLNEIVNNLKEKKKELLESFVTDISMIIQLIENKIGDFAITKDLLTIAKGIDVKIKIDISAIETPKIEKRKTSAVTGKWNIQSHLPKFKEEVFYGGGDIVINPKSKGITWSVAGKSGSGKLAKGSTQNGRVVFVDKKNNEIFFTEKPVIKVKEK